MVKNRKLDIRSEKIKINTLKKTEINRNNQKKVEYIIDNSSLSFLFSTNNLTTELLIPNVASDFVIAEKLRKLPSKAIPEAPKKTEIIFVDNNPNRKLIPTEKEFSDNTFSNLFFSICFTNLNSL